MSAMLGAVAGAACAHLVAGLAFPAPRPTTKDDEHARGVIGWSPKPTQDPLELFKREVAGPRTCGYYEDGFSTDTITCPTGTCMALAPSGTTGMVGCCTSFGGAMDYQQCGWVKRCYDYADVLSGLCDEGCQIDNFNRVCSASSRPHCQSWTYPGLDAQDFGCNTDPASTWITVSSGIADAISGTATAQLQFVPAAATITGLNGDISSRTTGTRSSATSTDMFTSASFSGVSSGSRTAVIVTMVIILVLLFGSLCVGGCIVFFFCKRSKRLTAKWKTGSSVALVDTRPPYTASSNIVPPPSSYTTQQPFSPLQNGAAFSYYGGGEHKMPAYSSHPAPAAEMNPPTSPAPIPGQNQFAQAPHAQPYHPPHTGAVEAPSSTAPRPNYAELG